MRDPHVNFIRYSLKLDEYVTFDNPPPVEVENEELSARLEDGILTCLMKGHYPSIELARVVTDRFVKSWEISVAMVYNKKEIMFQYLDADIVDRDPPPPGSEQIIYLSGTVSSVSFGTATLHVTRKNYPEPFEIFEATPDVETLWYRYEMYKSGKEHPQSMSYFCLSFIESLAGGKRKDAATLLNIDIEILKTLGELSSTRGDYTNIRKIKDAHLGPLTHQEIRWIESAIKALIRRVGEYDQGVAIPQISITDLPPL